MAISAYSVLALFVALRSMSCGFPQSKAILVLRNVGEALKREYRRMSEVDRGGLKSLHFPYSEAASALKRALRTCARITSSACAGLRPCSAAKINLCSLKAA